MRRLLLISLIMLCQIGQAQTIDGFTMGKERMAAVRNVPKDLNMIAQMIKIVCGIFSGSIKEEAQVL